MNPLPWLARPELAALAAALVHFLWQGTLIALLLAAVLRFFRIQRAGQRYACSLAALSAMAICPCVTFYVAAQWPHPVDIKSNLVDLTLTADAADQSFYADPWGPLQALARGAQPYLLALWLTGVCSLSAWLLCGMMGTLRLARGRLPLPFELACRVERLGRALTIDALPRVFLSRSVGEALVIGLWRPVVLVPAAWATEMPLVALEAIIAHELAHIRRWDLWVNLLQRVVETLLFYHPAVWWVSRQLRQVREMCCDELAVGATGRPVEYAETLELVARERLAGVRPALAAGIRGETNMNLLARVKNVLGGPAGEGWTLWPAGLLALLLPLGLWGATLGVLSLSPAAAVAAEEEDDDEDDDGDDRRGDRDDDRDDDDDRYDDDEREDGDQRDDDDADREDRHDRRAEDRDDDERERDEAKRGANDDDEGDDDDDERERKRATRPYRKEPADREDDAPPKKRSAGDPAPKKTAKDPVKKLPRSAETEAPVKKFPAGKKRDQGESAQLMAMVKELVIEVDRLRAEVRELREGQAAEQKESAASLRELRRLEAKGYKGDPAADLYGLKEERSAKERDDELLKEKDAIRAKLLDAIRAKAEAAEREAAERKQREAKHQAAIEEKLRHAAAEKERAAADDKLLRAAEEKERATVEAKLRRAFEEAKRLADRQAAELREQIAKERAAVEEKLRQAIEEKERAADREAAEKKERDEVEAKERVK